MNLLLALTGASGTTYARRLLDALGRHCPTGVVSIIVTPEARQIAADELGLQLAEDGRGIESGLSISADSLRFFPPGDFSAPFASGSSPPDAMVICPCTVGTLGRIAGGTADNLVVRAADVCLKERRKLILVVRETPLSAIHIGNMATVTQAGGIVLPACPSFYSRPQTVDQVADTVVARILDHLGIRNDLVRRWGQ